MSGSSTGETFILAPLFLPVALAVGAVSLVGTAVNAGIEAYEERQRRVHSVIGMVDAFDGRLNSVMSEQRRLNDESSARMLDELRKSRQKIADMANADDPEIYREYIGQLDDVRREISSRLFEIQDGFARNYQSKIEESISETSKLVNEGYARSMNELERLRSDMQAKEAMAMRFARQGIDEAKAALESLEHDFDGAKFAAFGMSQMRMQLNEAVSQFNCGSYESSMTIAKDALLSAVEEIMKADMKRQEWEGYHKLATVLSIELTAYMEAQSVITPEAKALAEERMGRKLDDAIVGVPIGDYTSVMEDGQSQYDYLLGKAKGIKSLMESDDASKLTTSELKKYVDILNSELYPCATKSIFNGIMNMGNAFSRQKISEDIIDFFEDHNFFFEGYSYDGNRHDGALHIGLANELTGEEIVITLAPQLTRGGDVQTGVEINQFAGDETDEDRKAFFRKGVAGAVVSGTPEAKIRLECCEKSRNRFSEKTELRECVKACSGTGR